MKDIGLKIRDPDSEYYKQSLYCSAPDNDTLIEKLEEAGIETQYIGSRAMLITLWEDTFNPKVEHYIGTSHHRRDKLHSARNNVWDSSEPVAIPPCPYCMDGLDSRTIHEVRDTSDRIDYGDDDQDYSGGYETGSMSYMEMHARGLTDGKDPEEYHLPKDFKVQKNKIGGAFSMPYVNNKKWSYKANKNANHVVNLAERYGHFKWVPGDYSKSAHDARNKNEKYKGFEDLCNSYLDELEATPNLLNMLWVLYFSWSQKFKRYGYDLKQLSEILVNYYSHNIRPRKKKLKFLKQWEKKWTQYIKTGYM